MLSIYMQEQHGESIECEQITPNMILTREKNQKISVHNPCMCSEQINTFALILTQTSMGCVTKCFIYDLFSKWLCLIFPIMFE